MNKISGELLREIRSRNPELTICPASNGLDGEAGNAIVRLQFGQDVQFFTLGNRRQADDFIDAVYERGLVPDELGVSRLVGASFGPVHALSCWSVKPRRTSWWITRFLEDLWIFMRTEKFKAIGGS